jgi:hypothetical protein
MKSIYRSVILFFITATLVVIIHSFGQFEQSQLNIGYTVAKQRLELKLITSFQFATEV